MSFDQEWAQLKERAGLRLAGVAPIDGGGGIPGPQLKVTPSLLENRAGEAETVRTAFRKADDETMKETGEIAKGLTGFGSAGAFAVFQERWREQMTFMDGLLGRGVAQSLRNAAGLLRVEDLDQADKARDIDVPKDVK
ncbi:MULTISPECIES: hypothetical protein [unclassified Streptomyces]|uniref:hypothetical protein n=1 Tax=unclassified Streptomyces TaxID=2593676 RepID=UPI0022B71F40|nr:MULTISPECIES: hypothetical protein [unclassified Streptomyces]MCZ7414887.1 hypothetical protein [Streptomyces sp. WMMC897]MCZ7431830.1 hypothetical protein [Streptomyces sp. WMMC1477]